MSIEAQQLLSEISKRNLHGIKRMDYPTRASDPVLRELEVCGFNIKPLIDPKTNEYYAVEISWATETIDNIVGKKKLK